MAHFEQHGAEVHRWRDKFASKRPYGMRHRKKRHHMVGIEEVRRMWGDEAAEAARQHILTDQKMEGWRDSDPLPMNEVHYQKIGMF